MVFVMVTWPCNHVGECVVYIHLQGKIGARLFEMFVAILKYNFSSLLDARALFSHNSTLFSHSQF